MAFWVYENVPTNQTTVHSGECGHCNDGRGRKTNRILKENRWHGPYGTQAAALAFACATGRPVRMDRCCPNADSVRVAKSSKRFALKEVDERTLEPADLFHHRMEEIYVVLRDEIDYRATRFLRSVHTHGGVEHAKRALRRPLEGQTGLARLRDEGRLHQSMEHFVVQAEFASLFTSGEIAEARRRLDVARGA